jgi:hypothetical protein
VNRLQPIHKLIRWLRIAEFGMYGIVICCIGVLALIVHR